MVENDQLPLGEMESLNLREKWPNEENNFTPWLEQNIVKLEEVLGISMEVQETEANIGSYFADIYATDRTGERDIIIENQYRVADHDHLGKSLVYAAGYDADLVIWIAEEFGDEHIDAINWLNNRTDHDTGFITVKAELVRIEDSPVSLSLEIVERPSAWKALTNWEDETDRQHIQFWKKFEERLHERGFERYDKDIKRPTASYGIPDGLEGATIRLARSVHGNLECAVRIPDPSGSLGDLDEDDIQRDLREAVSQTNIEELEPEELANLETDRRPEKKNDRVTLRYAEEVEPANREQWETYHDWLIDTTYVFDRAFQNHF